MPKLSGNVLVCGQNDVGQLGFSDDVPEKTRPALLPAVKDVVDIKAGGMHSLCLTSNGEIFSFGVLNFDWYWIIYLWDAFCRLQR